MCVDVPQLIVHVEQAPQTVVSAGDGPVARQDVLVELQVVRRLGELHQPRAMTRAHLPVALTTRTPPAPPGHILRTENTP